MYSRKYHAKYEAWRGGYFAPITIAKLSAIPSDVVVTQGGLSFAPASAMTHAGIGAFDLSTRHQTRAQTWDQCRQLMAVNIIPCPRGFTWDSFQGPTVDNVHDGNEHIHCLDLDCVKSMHPQAQAQVREILRGGDGLVGNAKYYGPPLHLTKWSKSKYNPNTPENIKKRKLELPTTAEVAKALSTDKGFLRAVANAVWSAGIPNPGKDRKPWTASHLVDWLGRVSGGSSSKVDTLVRQQEALVNQQAAMALQIADLTALIQKGQQS